ncbi:hypothetical protein JKF63_05815 [Porcisia hertigi]|uniref:Uncharacterized protein n=1 Tax=Porcisia hertigi TaxID=2761500 RepID=A0A836ICT6_9TRYP|nr:hypothetical protein JKF63_05815 [Porcisia hertigi]
MRQSILWCTHRGTIQLSGARRPHGLRSSNNIAAYTIDSTRRTYRTAPHALAALPTPTFLDSAIPATTTGGVLRTWLRCRGMVSAARPCTGTWQHRCISSSYTSRIPCARFGVSTARLTRATGQPNLPANANIFLIDVRKSQRKPTKKNPKSIMSSIITAHRAEAQKAKEELEKNDAYTPQLIFLFRTDDSKKQAARRQEQMDTHLHALGALGEFHVCVLNGTMSRNWTRFFDPPAASENAMSGQTEHAHPTSAPNLVSAAAAAAVGAAAASPLPTSGDITDIEDANRTGTTEAVAVAASPPLSSSGAMACSAGATTEARDVEDGEEWEEVEEVVEEDVEGEDGGGDVGTAQSCETAARGDEWEEVPMPTSAAATVARAGAHEKQKDATAPLGSKKTVNTVWAHVKRNTPSGDIASHEEASIAPAEASRQESPTVDEEKAVHMEDIFADDIDTEAAPRASPHPAVEATKMQNTPPDSAAEALDTSIPDASQRDTPDGNSSGVVLPGEAHTNLSSEAAAKERDLPAHTTDAEEAMLLGELEEFDIDGPLGEGTGADTRVSGAEPLSVDDTAKVWCAPNTDCVEPRAALAGSHMPAVGVRGEGDGGAAGVEVQEAENAAEKVSSHVNADGAATPATAVDFSSQTEQEDAAACVAAETANDAPTSTVSVRHIAASETGDENAAERVVSTTATECTLKPAMPPSPVPPPKPSTIMPVYPHVLSRLYYAASTVYLSDRAYVELPATANVLVIDHPDWDDAHLADIETALQQVDSVAGHVLLYPDAYAPQSEHVMGDVNAYRRSLLPFVFVFRTQLSLDAAMALQRRFTKALHARPTVECTAQRSLLAGKNDRTSVCVLSATESEKGGENPMLAPQPLKVSPASLEPSTRKPVPAHSATAADGRTPPRRAVHSPIHESRSTATTLTSTAYRTPSAARQRGQREGRTPGEADEAVQGLWDLLNSASPVSASVQRSSGVEMTAGQVEQASRHSGPNKDGAAPAEVQQRLSTTGAPPVPEETDWAEPAYNRTAGTNAPRTPSADATERKKTVPVAPNTCVDSTPPSQPPRLSYAPSLLNAGVATPFSSLGTQADAAGSAGVAHHDSPAATLQTESAKEKESAVTLRRGLFSFGTVAFGKDNGYYYSSAAPRRQRTSGSRRGLSDTDGGLDYEDEATDAEDGFATSSVLGSVSDLGLYPATARKSRQNTGGSCFTDEEIAKIEEDMLVAQVRRMERKEQRMEARRAMREKTNEAKTHTSSRIAASSSTPAPSSTPPTAKRSHIRKQRWHGGRDTSNSSKASATIQEQERDEDTLLEDFVNSLLVTSSGSSSSSSNKGFKAKKAKASVSYKPSQEVVRAPSYTSTTSTASSSTRKKGKWLAPRV